MMNVIQKVHIYFSFEAIRRGITRGDGSPRRVGLSRPTRRVLGRRRRAPRQWTPRSAASESDFQRPLDGQGGPCAAARPWGSASRRFRKRPLLALKPRLRAKRHRARETCILGGAPRRRRRQPLDESDRTDEGRADRVHTTSVRGCCCPRPSLTSPAVPRPGRCKRPGSASA
jgi:hypothetical protein